MTSTPTRRRLVRPVPLANLTLVWVMLWGTPTWASVLGGLLVAAGVLLLVPLPPLHLGVRVRPLALAVLAGRFLVDLVVASVEVAYKASAPWVHPRGRLVTIGLRSDDPLFTTLTAEMTCLVPGTMVVDLDPASRKLLLHVFDAPDEAALEAAAANVLAQEARILRALSATADADLAREVPR